MLLMLYSTWGRWWCVRHTASASSDSSVAVSMDFLTSSLILSNRHWVWIWLLRWKRICESQVRQHWICLQYILTKEDLVLVPHEGRKVHMMITLWKPIRTYYKMNNIDEHFAFAYSFHHKNNRTDEFSRASILIELLIILLIVLKRL